MSDIKPERVREIAAMDDQPVLRNLLVTQSYHDLARALTRVFGAEDLCWPIFAAWASNQAGVFIRKQEVPAVVRRILARPEDAPRPLRRIATRLPQADAALLATTNAIIDGIARFITGGNTIVFEELGSAFANLLETFSDPAGRTEQGLARLLEPLAEGPSMPDTLHVFDDGSMVRSNSGGQSLLRDAMTHYYEALHARDEDARAELLFLANVECGLHEQIRLQPYIAGALDAPIDQLLKLASSDVNAHPLADEIAALVRRVATELLMTLPTPGQILRLGTDLPAPPGAPLWPSPLTRLTHPKLLALSVQLGAYDTREANLEIDDVIEGWLNELLVRLDLVEREAQGTGADDWAALSDRMRFIFEYFRSRQRSPSLMHPPFDPEQLIDIRAGRVPLVLRDA